MASVVLDNSIDAADLLLEPAQDGRARFSREAYHRLVEIGVMSASRRVELLDGQIYMTSPIGPSQGGLITRLMQFFVDTLPRSLQCRVQLPIVVGDHSEPEPDIAIVRRRNDDYLRGHPTTADIALVIEVSQLSLQFDLGKKQRVYASAAIGEYWVVDIDRKVVVVHRRPDGADYGEISRCGEGDLLAPQLAPECKLDVAWLFH